MGLGNPGIQYAPTRHNAGFWVLDEVAKAAEVQFQKPFFSSYEWAKVKFPQGNLILIKPLTFMNLSGEILDEVVRKFSITLNNFLVVVDQLDLPPGQLRLKGSGSPAGHNGLKSLDHFAGTQNYKRLYFGIGRPVEGDIISWVLGTPSDQDQKIIQSSVEICGKLLPRLLNDSWESVVHEFNRPRG